MRLSAAARDSAKRATSSASMHMAYDNLDAATKEHLASLCAIHSLDLSRSRRHGDDPMTEAPKRAKPPVAHPIVRTRPETGRKCLFLGDHAWRVEGMPLEEGRQLIEELNAAIIRPELVYTHRSRPGSRSSMPVVLAPCRRSAGASIRTRS